MALRTLIIDDAVTVRQRLAALPDEIAGVEVVGQAGSAAEGAHLVAMLDPDLVILDIRMAGGSGISLLETLKRERPDVTVIMLTNYPYPQYRERCLRAGADFFLEKSANLQRLATIVKRLVARNTQLRREKA